MAQTARGIILNDHDELLVMERRKQGRHFFVLPGGHVEPNEAVDTAVVREILEETGLRVSVTQLLYQNRDELGNDQQLFLCQWQGGEPALPPQSAEAQLRDQLYAPRWMSMAALARVTFYPDWLLAAFAKDQAAGFAHNPRTI